VVALLFSDFAVNRAGSFTILDPAGTAINI